MLGSSFSGLVDVTGRTPGNGSIRRRRYACQEDGVKQGEPKPPPMLVIWGEVPRPPRSADPAHEPLDEVRVKFRGVDQFAGGEGPAPS